MSGETPTRDDAAGDHHTRGNRVVSALWRRTRLLQLLPGLAWIALLGCSFLFILFYSFLTQVPPQGTLQFTITHYVDIFTNSLYSSYLWRSLYVAVATTAGGIFLAYPVAYYLSFVASRYQNLLLLLIILPIWSNIVVRTYAWMQVLGEEGLLNHLFVNVLGILADPITILYSETAVIIGLIYVFLPFLVLPIYTSLNRVDRSHIEAAKNLGANNVEAFLEVTLPQSIPGVIAGVSLVFVMAFGSFVTPQLLGGSGNLMVANLIGLMFGVIDNWALGSALSVVFVAIVLALLILINRLVGIDELYGGGDSG